MAQTPNVNIGIDPFDDKKKAFEASDYHLTQEIATEHVWGPAEIENRQNRLSELAVKAWPLR